MEIKWYGHSCFLMTDGNGVRILTDPYGSHIGYELPEISADAVTISHEHADHNNISTVISNTVIVRSPGEYEVKGVKIIGIETDHDRCGGALRGKNTMFIYEMDGMRILITPGMVELGADEAEYNRKFGTYAAACCDKIFLVGRKHTEPIKEGILSKGFPEKELEVFDTVQEAISRAYAVKTSEHKYILLENDLPDNY